MKTTNFLLTLFAALCIGCQTTPGQLEPWAEDLRIAAEEAVPLILANNPDKRPMIERLAADLKILEESETISINKIAAVLRLHGVDKIESTEARLAILGGRMILNHAGRSVEFQTPKQIRLLAIALREGIEAGLQ